MARRFKFFSRCDGVAAVEFALLAPVLILFLCGILDLGNYISNIDIVYDAAREGARLYAVNAETSQQITTALQGQYPSVSTINITTAPVPGSTSGAINVTVTANSSVIILTPIISAFPFFPSNPYTVQGSCTMLVEQSS